MIEQYTDWLNKYNISLTNTQIEKLNSFARLVFKWNKKINLSAAKDLKEIIERHILDSLMPIAIGFRKEKSVVDLGSGGGFPAIPLAIACPDTDFILIEKVAKKCAFLNRAKRELKLENTRIENSVFEQIDFALPETLITRAVRIDKKLLKHMKRKGINTFYTFESSISNDFLEIMEYTLPSEGKTRFIAKREVI